MLYAKLDYYYEYKDPGELQPDEKSEQVTSTLFPAVLLSGQTLLPNLRQLIDPDSDKHEGAEGSGYEYDYFMARMLTVSSEGDESVVFNDDSASTVYLNPNKTYTIKYEYRRAHILHESYTYHIASVENKYPALPYSVATCVDRCLMLAEPLFGTEQPRYHLYEDDHDKLSEVISPEFTLTRSTLREQLKTIGGYINAEPRLTGYDTIRFDYYGKNEPAAIDGNPYIYQQVSQDINQYCTSVVSIVQNMVNQLDQNAGTTVQPSSSGLDTQRTEQINVRVNEGNGIILTYYPIMSVDKLECGLYEWTDEGSEDGTKRWITKIEPIDITAYVFEKATYDSNLSSYESAYPYSKCFGVYYTQGSKNIEGLYFRQDEAEFGGVFADFAIANILGAEQNIVDADTITNWIIEGTYMLSFRVTYTPIYTAHIRHGKNGITFGDTEFSQIYNQGENIVESRYYGEHVKGVASRLGNAEVTRTYRVKDPSDIPRAGQTIDGMVISSVESQIYPNYVKVTVQMTKEFNRLSQYVGISSNKRQYEVSEKQAFERNILLSDYIVCFQDGDDDTANGKLKASQCASGLIRNIDEVASVFGNRTGNVSLLGKMDAVFCAGLMKDGVTGIGNSVSLPVVASAFGNVASFSWRYKDNYSAGANVTFAQAGDISGYWQKDVAYGDYFGRIDNMSISFHGSNQTMPSDYYTAQSLPYFPYSLNETYGTYGTGNYKVLKDSREMLAFNYQVEAMSGTKGLIIGSGLMANLTLVSGNTKKARMFFLDHTIDKYAMRDYSLTNSYEYSLPLTYSIVDTDQGKAACAVIEADTSQSTFDLKDHPEFIQWVIAIPAEEGQEKTYTDDDGNIVNVTHMTGGDILLSRVMTNEDLTALKPITVYWMKTPFH